MKKQTWTDFFQSFKISIFLIIIYSAIFYFFNKYDWGHPWVKTFCFMALFLVIIILHSNKNKFILQESFLKFEFFTYLFLIFLVIIFVGIPYFREITQPAACDIGFTTHDAARIFTLQGKNPYEMNVNPIGSDQKYWGYHYGPGMILFYLPIAGFSGSALKIMSLGYIILLFLVIFLLIREKNTIKLADINNWLFAVLLVLIPQRFWFETFVQGSTDILPILLILLAAYFVKKKSFFIAGILCGLSFSAKFSPALFFILLFMRRKIIIKFFAGCFLGLLPLILFFLWNSKALINNVFLFHMIKEYDSTSLYSIVPQNIHFIFPLVQILAVVFFLVYNFQKKIEPKQLFVQFTLLLIIIEVTYKQIHANHLLWFIPLIAIIFAWNKNKQFSYNLASMKLFSSKNKNLPVSK